MPEFFPNDYEETNKFKKRKLLKSINSDDEVTALSIARNAHRIYDYLEELGVERPNATFVEAFQYVCSTLDVPYNIIDEAFYTQTPLTEKDLFDVSHKFNPEAKPRKTIDLPSIPITIDFYTTVTEIFAQLPLSFFQQFKKNKALAFQADITHFELEKLLQSLLQKVWIATKEELPNHKETTVEKARQMFLAYFYSNDQTVYRRETQDMLLESLEHRLESLLENNFVIDEHLKQLLEDNNSVDTSKFIMTRLKDWTTEKNYKRFLTSVSKTRNLSLMNRLLLLYQREEAMETKEAHDWIKEHRSLKKEAQPIFLFGENSHIVDVETGEILSNNKIALDHYEQLPLVPYFEKVDTDGRTESVEIPKQASELFVALDKMSQHKIIFENTDTPTFDEYSIHLVSGQTEKQTLQDLFLCLMRIEKNEKDDLVRLENKSVAGILLMTFGLDPLPIEVEVLTELQTLKGGETKIQKLMTDIISRSENFLETVEPYFTEKEMIKIRPTLEEEIKKAKEQQAQAMTIVATEKENKADNKNKESFSMSDYLEQVKEKVEENDDDGSTQ